MRFDEVQRHLGQIPHCDQRVLHAPGECEICDRHPQWQALRVLWGIAVTGHAPKNDELPCPAMYARPETFQVWGGNRPRPVVPNASASEALPPIFRTKDEPR